MEKAGTTMSSSSQSFEKRDFLKHQGRNLKFPRDEVFSSQKNIPMNKSEVINMCLADQEESRDDRLNPIDSSTPARNSLRMNFTPQTIYPTAEKIDSFRKMRGLVISGRFSHNVRATQPSLQTVERMPDLVDDLRREVERILADTNSEVAVDPEDNKERELVTDSVEVKTGDEDFISTTCVEECKDKNKERELSSGGGEEDVSSTTFIRERTDGDDEQEFGLPFRGVWCALPVWNFC